MNVTVKLTLDGMIRAMRWNAHMLAEDGARGYAATDRPDETARQAGERRGRRETEDDIGRE